MKHLVVGNWKMYIEKQETAKRLVSALKRRSQLLKKVDVVVAPPFTLVPVVAELLGKSKSIRLAAQTVSPFGEAKHTGDVSAAMLKSFGVSQVIIGHSERRAMGENDESIRAQIKLAQASGMTVVLCVGEQERDVQGSHFTVIEQQLSVVLKGTNAARLVVAYEPVWAIGKSAADAVDAATLQEMVIFIRKTLASIFNRAAALKVPILYGGSVEKENAGALIKDGGVAGFLVGHASTDADEFIGILAACA